ATRRGRVTASASSLITPLLSCVSSLKCTVRYIPSSLHRERPLCFSKAPHCQGVPMDQYVSTVEEQPDHLFRRAAGPPTAGSIHLTVKEMLSSWKSIAVFLDDT